MKEEGFVYFVRHGERIKIGFSATPEKRVKNLRRQFPGLETIAIVPNTTITEFEAHQRFAHLCVEGEWHHAEPELLDFIKRLPKPEPTEIDLLLKLRAKHRGNNAVIWPIDNLIRSLKHSQEECMPEWRESHIKQQMIRATKDLAAALSVGQ